MLVPTNEQGTIALFCTQSQQAGWEIVSIRTAFPDAILRQKDVEWRVEFEFKARNFVAHAHDFRECDLIICWQNDFTECPIPILELCDPSWVNVVPQKGNPLLAQIEYWRSRAIKAEERADRAETMIARFQEAPKKKSIINPFPIDHLIVRFLKENPGARLEDIAAHAQTTKGTVSKKVGPLVDAGVLDEVREGKRRILKVNGNHEKFLAS